MRGAVHQLSKLEALDGNCTNGNTSFVLFASCGGRQPGVVGSDCGLTATAYG